jgi:DNA polymerase III sliding clamp (beta) subunit (PCNA family)
MELKVPVDQLKKAIAITKKALPKLILQEERGHVLCKVVGDKLVVTATNNDIKARVIVGVVECSDSDFAFTIDPKVAEKILSKIELSEVLIQYDVEDKTVKIFTANNDKSFTTLQSFPPEKMLTFDDPGTVDKTSYSMNREAVIYALGFANSYLAPLKENKKQYDFIIINKGIVYGANGVNRMGFFVSNAFKEFENFKIRKESAPFIIATLKALKTETIDIIDTDKDIGVQTSDGVVYFSCLKSGIEAPKINTDILKGDAGYTMIDKAKLIKTMDRLVASQNSSAGAGVEINLSGLAESASVLFTLISNLKVTEQMECIRVNDDSDAEVKHVVDFKLFKGILGSFGDKDIKVYINDESKFFKVTASGELNDMKYLTAGIGSYSKVVNNG